MVKLHGLINGHMIALLYAKNVMMDMLLTKKTNATSFHKIVLLLMTVENALLVKKDFK